MSKYFLFLQKSQKIYFLSHIILRFLLPIPIKSNKFEIYTKYKTNPQCLKTKNEY